MAASSRKPLLSALSMGDFSYLCPREPLLSYCSTRHRAPPASSERAHTRAHLYSQARTRPQAHTDMH